MALVVTINAVSRDVRELEIDDILNDETNTCAFALDESWANRPQEGQEVIVTIDGTKVFAGS